jgi:DNA polymerase III subunit alpha
LLKDLKPKVLNDITLALSLIRPGASESGMKKIFLDRFHGKENIKYPHQKLAQILKETFGVFIYQEQVILAAQVIGGFNLPASDLLRRAITKKGKKRKKTDQEKLKKRFLDGAKKNQIDIKTAQDIYAQLAQFASFGFCKAHAATYGFLAYQSAYFKSHYPSVFMTAVLRNGGGYYPAAVYVAEARRIGVPVRPPDINRSKIDDSLRDGAIRLGISRVRDLTFETLGRIEKYQPFASLDDFLSRVKISEREMENLIKVGFFDSIESSRPKLLWRYRLLGKSRGNRVNNRTDADDLFGGNIAAPGMRQMPELIPLGRYEIFKYEKEMLELSASFHPLSLFANYRKIEPEAIYKNGDGASVSVTGWLADRKRIKTRNGQSMVFLTFDALEDTFEVVLFPDIYGRFNELIRSRRYLTVEGYLNIEEDNGAIIARNIYAEPTGLKEAPYI